MAVSMSVAVTISGPVRWLATSLVASAGDNACERGAVAEAGGAAGVRLDAATSHTTASRRIASGKARHAGVVVVENKRATTGYSAGGVWSCHGRGDGSYRPAMRQILSHHKLPRRENRMEIAVAAAWRPRGASSSGGNPIS